MWGKSLHPVRAYFRALKPPNQKASAVSPPTLVFDGESGRGRVTRDNHGSPTCKLPCTHPPPPPELIRLISLHHPDSLRDQTSLRSRGLIAPLRSVSRVKGGEQSARVTYEYVECAVPRNTSLRRVRRVASMAPTIQAIEPGASLAPALFFCQAHELL